MVVGDPIEKFVMLLERRMIQGFREKATRLWAASFGIEGDTYDRIRAEILRTWKLETKSKEVVDCLRDELRVRYLHVYNLAIGDGQFGAAVRALDSIAKLDGLVQDTTLIDVNVGVSGQITNRSRERVMDLMRKAKELSAASKIIDVPSNGNGSGSNGHGANGKSK